MIGVIQRKGAQYASKRVLRAATITEEDIAKGEALRHRVYSGVGNSEIFSLMSQYFTDLCMTCPTLGQSNDDTELAPVTCSTTVTWGYLIAKANEQVFAENHSHLILTAAITALGAARQARSHVKATIGLGNDIKTVKSVANAVQKIAEWGGRHIQIPDIDDCAEQVYKNLSKQGGRGE
jgi:hypothetical protein